MTAVHCHQTQHPNSSIFSEEAAQSPALISINIDGFPD
jgi:hypothetical protein